MRYDTPVFFVSEPDKEYDPDFGEWTKNEAVKTKKYANVTHMEAQWQQAVFGDVRADRLVLRLQRVYTNPYNSIEINGKTYAVDAERLPGDKQSLVVIRNG